MSALFRLGASPGGWARCQTSGVGPAVPPRTGHDITSQGLHLDLKKAQVLLKAGVWSGNVAPDCRPIEKQAAAGQFKLAAAAADTDWTWHTKLFTLQHPSPPLAGPATGTGTSLGLLKFWLPWLPQQWYRLLRHAGAGLVGSNPAATREPVDRWQMKWRTTMYPFCNLLVKFQFNLDPPLFFSWKCYWFCAWHNFALIQFTWYNWCL